MTLEEHIFPALKWLKSQDKPTFVVKLKDLPKAATQELLVRTFQKRFRVRDIEKCQIHLEVDKQSGSKGIGFIQSTSKETLEDLLRLHNKLWAHKKIKSYLVGYPYF